MSLATRYETKASPKHGQGQIACEDIAAGTLIIFQAPLFMTSDTSPKTIYEKYRSLGNRNSVSRIRYRDLTDVGHLPPLPPGTEVPELSLFQERKSTRAETYGLAFSEYASISGATTSEAGKIITIFKDNYFKIRNDNEDT